MKTPITVWKKLNMKTGEFEFNHIEDGHSSSTSPTPVSPAQKRGWSGAQWQATHAHLIDYKVTYIR